MSHLQKLIDEEVINRDTLQKLRENRLEHMKIADVGRRKSVEWEETLKRKRRTQRRQVLMRMCKTAASEAISLIYNPYYYVDKKTDL